MRSSTRRSADGVAVVEIRGEVDMADVAALRAVLDEAIRTRPPRVVVDLGHVTFIDSTGLGVLVAGKDAAASRGVAFAVRNPAPVVAHQLRVTGLEQHLTGRTG